MRGPRWRTWPPARALEIERGEQLLDEPPLANEPRAFTSEIDPQYPVFGNPLTSTVRRNFAVAKEEIEDLYRRIADLVAGGGGGGGGSGTVTSITAGTGLTGGTITGTGTIALATPVSLAYGGTGVSAANAAAALTALGGAPLASPNFNGVPTAPTAAAGTATMQVATTAFVENAVGTSGGGTMMSITAGAGLTGGTVTTSGTIALDSPVSLANGGTGIAAANAAAALAALGGAGLASPALTGTPTAPTPAAADDSMAIATTAFVKAAVDAIDALPTGGAQYDVLSKASATDGDVAWRGAGVRPNSNTVIGAGAFGTGTGSNSVAIGTNALAASGAANFNVAIGHSAAPATSGSGVVAVGRQALNTATAGNFLVAIGDQAMRFANGTATAGAVAVGNQSLQMVTVLGAGGSNDVAVGSGALGALVTSGRNAALGANAGAQFGPAATPGNLAASTTSVFIGADSRAAADNEINQIVIGASAFGHGSNTITLGNADITALYTRAGLVLGDDPTGGAKGPGTINLPASGGYYVDGESSLMFEDQTIAGQKWQIRATGGRASVVDPAGVNRFYIGQGVGDQNISIPYCDTNGALVISRNTANIPAFGAAHLQLIGRDYVETRLVMDTYAGTTGPHIWMRSAGGTGAAPAPTNLGQSFGVIAFTGCHTAGNMAGTASAQIMARALQAWSAVSTSSELVFTTSPVSGSAETPLTVRSGVMIGAPVGGVAGDTGYGTVNASVGYYINGEELKAGAGTTVAATAPSSPVAGDLWFDTVNNQLKTYNGTTWVVAGVPTGGDLTLGNLEVESITLDGTPMVPLAGGDPGEVVTKLADGSIAWAPPSAGLPAGGNPGDVLTKPNGAAAWARIGDPDGLVIGNPTGGAMGPGTINIEGGIYQDGERFEGDGAGIKVFPQSFAWTAGVEPDNVCIYINNTGQELEVKAATGAVEVPNGAAATVRVVRADDGQLLSAGPDVTDPFDVDQPAGTVEELNLHTVLPAGWRLGLRTTGTWQDSVATITVQLGLLGPPRITSPLTADGVINTAFSYQIVALGATSFSANVPPPVGLTVNTATGLISGVPTVVGDTNVTISASNSAGTNTRTLVIRVLDEPTAWSPARASTTGRVVFSNQFRTMHATGGTPYVSCLSNSNRPPGKYYVEVTVNADYGWFGLANTNADLETFVSFTYASAGMWYEGVGQNRIRLSLNIGGSWSNFGIGAGVIGMAFDVSGSGANKMWARNVTTDGSWTGFAGSVDGDPAGPTTSTNGIPIPVEIGDGPYYLMASSGFGTNVTMNPGPTGLGTPPAGFQWWDS